jgi:formyltetrahydrofolate-dependent phosphoribosylglycinamide formyltransferase
MGIGMKSRIAVCVSGGGRSLSNLIDVQDQYDYRVALVVASSPKIGAVAVAERYGIPLLSANFANDVEDMVYEAFAQHGVELVVLAGFLKLFPVRKGWEKRVINIHPALLPKYGGKGMHGHHVHAAVIKAAEKESGATVHYVNERYDEGEILAQARVQVVAGDSPESLAARVFAAESELLPQTVHKLVSDLK